MLEETSKLDQVMRSLEEMRLAAAPRACEAQVAASEAQRISPSWTRGFAIVFAVQAMLTFGLVAAARAGPCTQEIEAVQAQVDAVLEAAAAAGPTEPES